MADEPAPCHVCHRTLPRTDLVSLDTVRTPLADFIRERHGTPVGEAYVCRPDLYEEQGAYVIARVTAERGSLTAIEREVARKAAAHTTIARDIDAEFDRGANLASRAADAVARFGGSWRFVFGLSTMLVAWMILNVALGKLAPDPYPFILLNLLLSCVAAFQAPLILMSQSRMAEKDRRKADQDFLVNLKAEIEVASLHEKIDHLLHVQWNDLVELQEMQLDMLRDLVAQRRREEEERM